MKSAAGGMSSARKGCMESRQRRVCYQSEGEGEYALKRDAILRGAQITSNGLCPLITYQSFGLDKKLSNPIGLLNFLEVPPGFEPGIEVLQTCALPLGHGTLFYSFYKSTDTRIFIIVPVFLERITGLEPATSTLARSRSTK